MGMQDKVEEQSEAWQLRAVTMIVCELVGGSGKNRRMRNTLPA
ncbi:hypothetical protein J4U02_gp150 [Mycobacterium phage Aziz]|uniref:Uncharacterized protein n=1 Tax=Mycobacterium phage Aziz TaxID=2762281 RepID=A0A7G8LHP0_9CAUD|nr:hypothetical protein J4U02_gp150 [Mycobacterium phage Aziz]ASR75950.1 hypothetical protein SEA_GENEVAB15_108 [Mycobacterium phage GenevaB15]QNJ56762.1 hypothetical protein SEA_AZIZ_105 [Mycobacterium phage Aziz]